MTGGTVGARMGGGAGSGVVATGRKARSNVADVTELESVRKKRRKEEFYLMDVNRTLSACRKAIHVHGHSDVRC